MKNSEDTMGENTLGQIRSFVIRTTRMSPAQKRGWERYGSRFIVPYRETPPVSPDELFPDRSSRPLVLDIGFGMGRELAELAERQGDRNFIGVEVHKPGIGRLLLDLGAGDIANVKIIPHDVVEVLRDMIPPGTLDGVHLFFPDPWPKARHHKRRLVRPGFPEMVAPVLKEGGYIYMVTDWEDYAYQMVEVMTSASRYFRNEYDHFAPPQQWRPQTAFERKGLSKGHRIYELLFRHFSHTGSS